MNTITSERLNLIIAVCAIVISLASFYATYLQAESANQQVKAMTYPLLQLEHGNFDLEKKSEKLYFTLRNSGVGPAQVRSLQYLYAGETYASVNAFLNACCQPEYTEFGEMVKSKSLPVEASLITGDANNAILSAGDQLNLLVLSKTTDNLPLWNRINKERFNSFAVKACYCSLLDKCYELDGEQRVTEVLSCK